MTGRATARPNFSPPCPDKIDQPVLVIEDQRSLAQLMAAMLRERWECEVDVAGSLADVRRLLASGKRYLVALSDLNLPDAPHGEVVDVVIAAGIPTIALTAAFGNELRETILQKGVMDYVLKNSVNAYAYVCELVGRLHKNQHTKVLAVDDSQGFQDLMRQFLEMYGLQVLTAASGQEAMALLTAHPDIRMLLVDYEMPGMDGLEVTRAARQTLGKDRLAIIGISSNDDPFFMASFLKNGANDYIHKPFCFEELVCRVNQNLEVLELIETNQRAANRDFLTGLFNRRYFFVEGQRSLSPVRPGAACTVAMIDIDHFKQVNDRYGHDCGDLVLKQVADTIARHFADFLPARLGGEEFAILLKDEPLPAAAARLDALREAVAALPIAWQGETLHITLSGGLAPVSGNQLDPALRLADQFLYQAKAAGRNRILSADPGY